MHRSSGTRISQAASVIRPCSDAEEMEHTVGVLSTSLLLERRLICVFVCVSKEAPRCHLGGLGENPSDVGLHARHSPLHQAASTTDAHARQIQFIHQVTEQRRPSWDCYHPCDHQGELKGKALRSALRRGGGAFYSKEISPETVPFSPTLPQKKNDTSIV